MSLSEQEIKEQIIKLFENKTQIHVTTSDGRIKINNAEATIIGVYNRFLSVKSLYKNYYATFTIKYIDIKIGKVVIKELVEEEAQ